MTTDDPKRPGASLPPEEEAQIDSLFDRLTDASLSPPAPTPTSSAPPPPLTRSSASPPLTRSSAPPPPLTRSSAPPPRRSSSPSIQATRSSLPAPSVSLRPSGNVAGVVAQGHSEAPQDGGAAAARRTVRKRAGRRGSLAFVGRGAEVLRARAGLLAHMAQHSTGHAAARLWTATAELHAQLDEHDVARGLRTRACDASALDLTGLRASQRDAQALDDHRRWIDLLRLEAGMALPVMERARALTVAAGVALFRSSDAVEASALCKEALAIDPQMTAAALLWMTARRTESDRVGEAEALRALAAAWKDSAGRCAAFTLAGHACEAAGEPAVAFHDYESALQASPSSTDATWGVMRTARAAGQPLAAAQAAAQLARTLHDPEARAAWLRSAARAAAAFANDGLLARGLLADDQSRLGLRLSARVTANANDPAGHRLALERWAQATGGSERATALVDLARLALDAGDYDAAEHALVDATVADGNLGTVRVVREMLARKRGDATGLVSAASDDHEDALTAAAKIAADPSQGQHERELLRRASHQSNDALTADVIALDAAAASGDREAVFQGVLRKAARARPEDRLGPLLSLLDYLPQDEWGPRRNEIEHELRVSAAQSPLALRQCLRAASDAQARAALLLAEADAVDGEHAAMCATVAGELLARDQQDPSRGYRDALSHVARYEPAAWALERRARDEQDTATLLDLQERLAEQGRMPAERAARLFRAGLLHTATSPEAAADRLRRALIERPGDPIVTDLLLRLSAHERPIGIDGLLLASAADTGPEVAHAARIRAGALLEDAGDWAGAAKHYRFANDSAGRVDPFVRVALDRVELLAQEQARVAQRRTDAVRDAEDAPSRMVALSQLAEFERDRGDMQSAVLALQSLREVSPYNVQTMRTLERYYFEKQRSDSLIDNVDALIEALAEPMDVAAYLRFRLALSIANQESVLQRDPVVTTSVGQTGGDVWCMRQEEAAARRAADHDRLWRAVAEQVPHLTDPMERAALCLRALDAGGSQAATMVLPLLSSAVEGAPQHPMASEDLARLHEQAGNHAAAAAALEVAARAAATAERRLALWYRAGAQWQDHERNDERALGALREAASIQLLYRDTFSRLHQLLSTRGEREPLAALIEQRIAAGGDPSLLSSLHGELSALRRDLQDRRGAKEGLRAALTLDAGNIANWHALADMELADESFSQAADALIQLARLSKDQAELRWAFFTLGDLYENRLPDLKRAEIAFSRAVKLAPDDTASIARLAKVFQAQGQLDMAERALSRLIDLSKGDPRAWLTHQIELALVIEQGADARRAEDVLENARRSHPLELEINRAIEALHRRQSDEAARAMHLSRAINEYRHAIAADITDERAWMGLVDMLERHGKRDAADLCAQVAQALDVEAPSLRGRRRPVAAPDAMISPSIDDLIAPPGLTPSTRVVLRQLGPVLEKLLAIDTRGPGAERPKTRAEAVQRALATASTWVGIDRVELYVNRTRSCHVSDTKPWTLAVGESLLNDTTDAEKLFLFTRALKLGASDLVVAVRSDAQLISGAIHGLVHHIDPAYEPKGVDVAVMDEWARRIGKAVPRKLREELAPNVLEMAGDSLADPARLGHVCERFGARAALVATGDFRAAVTALLREANLTLSVGDARQAQQLLARHPVASDLLTFALSDACFSAREIALSSAVGPQAKRP